MKYYLLLVFLLNLPPVTMIDYSVQPAPLHLCLCFFSSFFSLFFFCTHREFIHVVYHLAPAVTKTQSGLCFTVKLMNPFFPLKSKKQCFLSAVQFVCLWCMLHNILVDLTHIYCVKCIIFGLQDTKGLNPLIAKNIQQSQEHFSLPKKMRRNHWST